jgi:glycosyltransferase involved in cell wall biosynthesis
MVQDIREAKSLGRFSGNLDQSMLSVVIPCYNDHLYVEQAVDSALAQTWPYKEIIIVDDGSFDRTKKVLSELESDNIKIFTQKNRGVSAARNMGIQKASGKFILVLDSDDYFELNFIEKAIPIIKESSDIKIITCYARWFWNSTNFQIFFNLSKNFIR